MLSWTQPFPDGAHGIVLRAVQTPCPLSYGDTWKHPATENHRVIDPESDRPERIRGQVDAMRATSRRNGYDQFLRAALSNAGYTWDQHGHRQT